MLFEQNIASNITRDKEPKHLKYYILNNSTYLQNSANSTDPKLKKNANLEKVLRSIN